MNAWNPQLANQRLDELEKETKRLFHFEGELQKQLDEIEDGFWQGRKIAAWDTWIFPCSVADEQTLKALRSSYRCWLKIYQEYDKDLESLHKYYSTSNPCKRNQHRIGSARYQLELGSVRLVELCTTARTGIPFSSWANRHAIRSLDLTDCQAEPQMENNS